MMNLQKTKLKYVMSFIAAAQLSACSSVDFVKPDDLTELEKMEQARENAYRKEKREALCRNTVDDGSEDRGDIIRRNCSH